MTQTEALRLALEGLEFDSFYGTGKQEAITAIKAALEAKNEPVAYINVEQRKLEWAKYVSWGTPTVVNLPKIPLYTTPPQRTWVGLTDEEIKEIVGPWGDTPVTGYTRKLFDQIEAKLKEKNT